MDKDWKDLSFSNSDVHRHIRAAEDYPVLATEASTVRTGRICHIFWTDKVAQDFQQERPGFYNAPIPLVSPETEGCDFVAILLIVSIDISVRSMAYNIIALKGFH